MRRPKGLRTNPKRLTKARRNLMAKKCFDYDEQGHYKRNCPIYLAELKEKKEGNIPITQLHVLEANFSKKESLI